ncbi:hypothetical protein LAZ67_13000664 [Cordylochernes scorpioides]|uniref:Protein kinase domain-containing protein n=1 Tax=Cordylochernes scorpioides TaxID=51811 RepID=A0ABY6L352_9ARAC|nr:hypothetical protein LAZ67_13000664 [Cordylochernes scorpioides]
MEIEEFLLVYMVDEVDLGYNRRGHTQMVQELLPMGSLLDFLLDQPQEVALEPDLLLWVAQIAVGMLYLERKRLVHRDLAARNILLHSKSQYGRSTSMICSVLKRKESIKSVTPAKGLTIISKLRTSLHENMEKLLIVWVTEKQLQGDTLTQTIICEKARARSTEIC